MITKEEFKVIMISHGIDSFIIERTLSKKNKTLYARGSKNNIIRIIDILKRENIPDEKIFSSTTTLSNGKPNEIEKIFKVLDEYKIDKDTIQKCLTVLATGKADEIKETFDILSKSNVNNEIIKEYFYTYFQANHRILKEYLILQNQIKNLI